MIRLICLVVVTLGLSWMVYGSAEWLGERIIEIARYLRER